jgi:hypothetical protein
MVPSPISRPDTLVGVDALIRADFETFSDLWFARLIWSSVIVAIGIFFEGPEVFHEVARVIRRTLHVCKPEKDKKSAVVLCGLIGWLLVAGGVAGEGLCEGFIWKADGILRSFNNMLVAQATKQAGDAVLGAATANVRVAEAQRQATKLGKEAEDERLARVKIEAAVGWRSLSDQQKRDIGAALSGFAQKAGASIWFNGSSTETEMFADDIAEALRFGHVNTVAPSGIMEMRQSGKWNEEIKPVQTGVIVQSTKAPAAIELAAALIKQLNDRGFDAIRQTDPPFDSHSEPIIWVNVEPRPKGPQGEYKLQAERDAKTKNKQTQSSQDAK